MDQEVPGSMKSEWYGMSEVQISFHKAEQWDWGDQTPVIKQSSGTGVVSDYVQSSGTNGVESTRKHNDT